MFTNAVKYIKSTKHFQVQKDRRWEFTDRIEAQWFALSLLEPEIYAEASALADADALLMFDVPAIATRTLKAAWLVARGGVLLPEGMVSCEIARVKSSNGDKLPYYISYQDDHFCCTCKDWMLQHAPVFPYGQRCCKHILAVIIADALAQRDYEAEEDPTSNF